MEYYRCSTCGSIMLLSTAPSRCMHDTPAHPCAGPMTHYSPPKTGYVSRYSYGGAENPLQESQWGDVGYCTHVGGSTAGKD